MVQAIIDSPVGPLQIMGSATGIQQINYTKDEPISPEVPQELKLCKEQLEEYFAGKRKTFDFPLDIQGTDFQKSVWNELLKIPFGKTCSYLDIANALGDKNATRAVGTANGSNNISIVIPCHRVIGSDGKLTGYAGGLDRKKFLLELEGMPAQGELF